MILTVIYKNGRIYSINNVDRLDSRERPDNDGDYYLHVTLKPVNGLSVDPIPTNDLQQWTLMTEMGARVVEIKLKPGDLDALGNEIPFDEGNVPK